MSVPMPAQLEGEKLHQYEAFLVFCSLPRPSLLQTYRIAWDEPEAATPHNSAIYDWCRRFNWKQRRAEHVKAVLEEASRERLSLMLAQQG